MKSANIYKQAKNDDIQEPEIEDKYSYPEIVSAYKMWLGELDADPEKFLKDKDYFIGRFLLILSFDAEKGEEYIDVPYSAIEDYWNGWASEVYDIITKHYKTVSPPSDAIKIACRHYDIDSFLGHWRTQTKAEDEFNAPEIQIAFNIWKRSPEALEGDYRFEPFWRILMEVIGSQFNASLLAKKELARLGIDSEKEPRRYRSKLRTLIKKNKAATNLFSKKMKDEGLTLKKFSIDQIQKAWTDWAEEENSAETLDAKEALREGSINAFSTALVEALKEEAQGMEEDAQRKPEEREYTGTAVAGFFFPAGKLRREYYRVLNRIYGGLIPRLRERLVRQLEAEKGIKIDIQDFDNLDPLEERRLKTWGVEDKILEMLDSKDLIDQLKEESLEASMPGLLERFVGEYNTRVAIKNKSLTEEEKKPLIYVGDFENVTPEERDEINKAGIPERIQAFVSENPNYFAPQMVAARVFAENLIDRRGFTTALPFPEILVRAASKPISKYELLDDFSLIQTTLGNKEKLEKRLEKVNSQRHKNGQRLVGDQILGIDAAEIFEQELNRAGNTQDATRNAMERILWAISGVPKIEYAAAKRIRINREITHLNEQLEKAQDPNEQQEIKEEITDRKKQLRELAKQTQTEEDYKFQVDRVLNSARRDLAEILAVAWEDNRQQYREALEEEFAPEEKMNRAERTQYENALELQLDLEYPPVVAGERFFNMDRQLKREIENARRVLQERVRGGRVALCPDCGAVLEAKPWMVKGNEEIKKEYCPRGKECKFNRMPVGHPEGPHLIESGAVYEHEKDEEIDREGAEKAISGVVAVAKNYKDKLVEEARTSLEELYLGALLQQYNEKAKLAKRKPINPEKLTPQSTAKYNRLKQKAKRLVTSDVVKLIANRSDIPLSVVHERFDKFATIDVYEQLLREAGGGEFPANYAERKQLADEYLADALPEGVSMIDGVTMQQLDEYVPGDTLQRLSKSKKMQDFLRKRRQMRDKSEALVYKDKPAHSQLRSVTDLVEKLVALAPPGYGDVERRWAPPFLRAAGISYKDALRELKSLVAAKVGRLMESGETFDESKLVAQAVSKYMLAKLSEGRADVKQDNYDAWVDWYGKMAKGMPELPKEEVREKIKPKPLKDFLKDGKILAGFTGTQKGMTPQQSEKLRQLLQQLNVGVLNHGKCIGADEEADAIAQALGIHTRAFPGDNEGKQAECEGAEVVQEPKANLERNQDIVNKSYILIAAPESEKEIMRSGTWTTVRRGRKKGMTIYFVMPDGSVYSQVGSKEMEPFDVQESVPEEPKPELEGEPEEERKPYEAPSTVGREIPEGARAEYEGRRNELIQLIENADAVVEKDMPDATPEQKAEFATKLRERAKQMLRQLPEGLVESAIPKKSSYEKLLEKRARRAKVREKYLKKLK